MGAVIETEEKPDTTDNSFGEDLEHWTCPCNPDLAFCGADLTGAEFLDPIDSPDDCIVCLDFAGKPCERCGK